MRPHLEELVLNYFFKEVKITLEAGAKFSGYLVGIKLPAGQLIMLHLLEHKNIEKYIKHVNPRWLLELPYEFIKEITLVENASQQMEDKIVVAVLKEKPE